MKVLQGLHKWKLMGKVYAAKRGLKEFRKVGNVVYLIMILIAEVVRLCVIAAVVAASAVVELAVAAASVCSQNKFHPIILLHYLLKVLIHLRHQVLYEILLLSN